MKKHFLHYVLNVICLGVSGAIVAPGAEAQVIERHLPAVPQGSGSSTLSVPEQTPASEDNRPIGPDLRAIHLLGLNEAAKSTVADGISYGAVDQLHDPARQNAMKMALLPFLNKPISRKLIADIEAAIAGQFREDHHPFVSLSTPEQEISRGTLQIQVIEFKVEDVSVRDAKSSSESASIIKRIDLQQGDAIDTQQLSSRLDWVNQYPFRQLDAVFAPGTAAGSTDLILNATEKRAWQVYGGYNNDGSRSTGYDRWFAGGAVGSLLGQDSVLAFQATGSTDAVKGYHYPGYESAAVTYQLPVGPGRIESLFDVVQTNQRVEDFISKVTVYEGRLGYRLPLTPGDYIGGNTSVSFGLEANHQDRDIYFADQKVYQVGFEVWQLYAGLQQHQGPWGDWDVSLHFSPGNVTPQNSDRQAELYTVGAMSNTTYAYLNMNYSKQFDFDFGSWETDLIGQYSPNKLPYTAQTGLGGLSLVRGYSTENGAFDSSAVMHNELRFNTPRIEPAVLTPYLFADAGWGRSNSIHQSENAASTGAGLRVYALKHISLDALGGVALIKNNDVDPGDGFTRISVSIDF